MPLQYKPTKRATDPGGPSLTEQEHTDSCNINLMMRSLDRGQMVRGNSSNPQYGYDDIDQTYLSIKLQKEELENELSEISLTTEFSEEELSKFDPSIVKKFGFKLKKLLKRENDDLNDENANKNQKSADLADINTDESPKS